MESIDIFDTAIFRDVYEPVDIFSLVEKKVGNSFRVKRQQAEKQAHQRYGFPNINQIYSYLNGFNPQIEIDMEMNHIYANPKILEMYKQCPSRYIFISDMYLSSQVLKKMLEKCGYENPRVFVSCEQKCNKGSGLLFEKVQRQVDKITKHYGDNYRSDIEGARKAGIEPVYKPALHKMELTLPMVKSPLLKKYAAALETSEEKPLTKLAKWYAPLIYQFTKWVISKRKPGQSIYFLSRDMFMPYLISTTMLHEKDVHYLYCSRRSLAPLFIESKEKSLLDKMHIVLTPEEFKIKQQKGTKECMRYLKESGIKDGDILVDIGYSGSTQNIIERFLKIKLKGLYMQLDQAMNTTMDMEMYLNRYALTYRFLAEFILTSPEDCVEDYKDGRVVIEPDNKQRKEFAKHVNSIILDEKLFRRIDRMDPTVFDVEQMLIHIQNYPSMEMMELFNRPILTNRRKMERGINFNRKAIMEGKLLDCYKQSYARPLFKKMLMADPELKGLVKLLPS